MIRLSFVLFGVFLISGGLSNYSSIKKLTFLNSDGLPQEDTIISWDIRYPLKWDDFCGNVDTLSSYEALTYSMVMISPEKNNANSVEFEVTCSFEKTLSWSKNKDSESLLKHEQLHFDISELATRRLRKRMKEHNYIEQSDLKDSIQAFFLCEEFERSALNQEYDRETDHGLIKKKQKEWEKRIAKELKAFNSFASSRVIVRRVKNGY